MHFSEKDQFCEFRSNRLLFAPLQLKCWLSLWTICFSWKKKQNNTLTISSFCFVFFMYTRRVPYFMHNVMCCSSISCTHKKKKILIKISFYYPLITTKQVNWFGCSTLYILRSFLAFRWCGLVVALTLRSQRWSLLLLFRSFRGGECWI